MPLWSTLLAGVALDAAGVKAGFQLFGHFGDHALKLCVPDWGCAQEL